MIYYKKPLRFQYWICELIDLEFVFLNDNHDQHLKKEEAILFVFLSKALGESFCKFKKLFILCNKFLNIAYASCIIRVTLVTLKITFVKEGEQFALALVV
jgi:hypothetical protein